MEDVVEGRTGRRTTLNHPLKYSSAADGQGVFVLTPHEREPLELTGTIFHFLTDGPESALAQAHDAAAEDVLITGGAQTVQQYLRAGLLDEMVISLVPFSSALASGSSTTWATRGRGRRPNSRLISAVEASNPDLGGVP